MKCVLVTGANGFVGSACMQALQSFPELYVVGLSRYKPPHTQHWIECDLLNSLPVEALAQLRPHYLLHTAWYTTPEDYLDHPINDTWLMASLELLESFAALGGQRAVFVGSMAEYGLAEGSLSETKTRCKPLRPYACAKHILREQAEEKAKHYNLSFAWARLFHPFGPREHHHRLIPSLCSHLLKGKPINLSTSYNKRDFMPVSETGRALAMLLISSAVQGAINIGTGKGYSIRWIAHRIADRLGAHETLLNFGALPPRTDESTHLVADSARLEREVGYRPIQTLDEGINEALAYWQAYAGLT